MAGELTPQQLEILELIDGSGRELQRLIEQLLDYNLLQHSRRVEVERLDVATLVREVLAKHRLALANKGMRVESFDGPVEWELDRTATGHILDNLVSNAIAYGADGGELEIRVRQRRNRLELEVANSGEPIAEVDRPRLFEAFYQGAPAARGRSRGRASASRWRRIAHASSRVSWRWWRIRAWRSASASRCRGPSRPRETTTSRLPGWQVKMQGADVMNLRPLLACLLAGVAGRLRARCRRLTSSGPPAGPHRRAGRFGQRLPC